MLILAVLIALVIASPQLWASFKYYPHSVRSTHSYESKTAIGNVPFWRLVRGLLGPTRDTVDGVIFSETVTYIGLIPLAILIWRPFSGVPPHPGIELPSVGILILSVLLAMGNRTPVFKWLHPVLLRIPARFCYWISMSLAMLVVGGLRDLQLPAWLSGLYVLDLATRVAPLTPTYPFAQRWETPSHVFQSFPLCRRLRQCSGRVSGLPYPLRTGQVTHTPTLGYNGGSQTKWMKRLRNDDTEVGAGAHDWFATRDDGPLLDRYGVRYAYTMRPLKSPKWKKIGPRLYENVLARPAPSWEECQWLPIP